MSKRFGRKRKWKLEAKIQDLKKAYEMASGLASYEQRKHHEYSDKLHELIEEFKGWWDHSVLLNPDIVTHYNNFPPYYRLAQRKIMNPFDFRIDAFPSEVEMQLFIQTLEAVRIAAGMDIENRYMHIILRVGDKEVCYYIDPRSFELFKGMPRHMERFVSEKICAEFNRVLSNYNRKDSHDQP